MCPLSLVNIQNNMCGGEGMLPLPKLSYGAGYDGTNSSVICANCVSKFHSFCPHPSVNIEESNLWEHRNHTIKGVQCPPYHYRISFYATKFIPQLF